MTGRCSVFIATSLDGFIARRDGSIDWLDRANAAVPTDEDCGYAQFIDTIDALVMGRGSFEKVLSFPEWPYGDIPVYVLSHSIQQLPAGVPETVQLSRENPAEVVRRASESGHQHLYVDGGKVIQSFLAAGLITELTLTVIPVLLGSGLRLFGDIDADIPLRVISSKVYSFGFVQNHYAVAKAA
jgi:dihydrofolate reductase